MQITNYVYHMQLMLQLYVPGFVLLEAQWLGKIHNRGLPVYLLYLCRTLSMQGVALKEQIRCQPYKQFYTYIHHGTKKFQDAMIVME